MQHDEKTRNCKIGRARHNPIEQYCLENAHRQLPTDDAKALASGADAQGQAAGGFDRVPDTFLPQARKRRETKAISGKRWCLTMSGYPGASQSAFLLVMIVCVIFSDATADDANNSHNEAWPTQFCSVTEASPTQCRLTSPSALLARAPTPLISRYKWLILL